MTPPVGIRCLALAGRGRVGIEGQWLMSYDPDAFDGRGEADWTVDPRQALQFPDHAAAYRCWQQTSQVRPVREDGRPNRPLTAFTAEVVAIPESARR